MYERALKILEAHCGPDHYEVAITLANLSVAHFKLQEQSLAFQRAQRACAILINDPMYGIEHAKTEQLVEWIQSECDFSLSDLHPSLVGTGNNPTAELKLKRTDHLSEEKVAPVAVDESKSSSASDQNIHQARGDERAEEATSTSDSETSDSEILIIHCRAPEAISTPTQTTTLTNPSSVLITLGSPSLFASGLQLPNSKMNHSVPIPPLETKVDDSQASEETVAELSNVPP